MNTILLAGRSMKSLAMAALALAALVSTPAGADAQTVNACYVPEVGAIYLVNQPGLPTQCLASSHVALSWSEGGITSITAGDGLTGGEVTTTGVLGVNFDTDGSATTVARGDHVHALEGTNNTGIGDAALERIAGGTGNTALGASALTSNTTGSGNTAGGSRSLLTNATGSFNAAFGGGALLANEGDRNSAFGYAALVSNIAGNRNAAFGTDALRNNTTGTMNAGVGMRALHSNASGNRNTAVGWEALLNANGGHSNLAIGARAGVHITTGSANVIIGNPGASDDNQVIRIGFAQSEAYMAGISGQTSAGGVGVFVNGDGKLGTVTSSARFKEDIEDLGSVSRRLFQLRPVQFRYAPEYDDGSRLMQYGLIAEEVESSFPELVVHDADGKVETVRYHLLSVLLLNEVLRQEEELEELRASVAALAAAVAELQPGAHGRDDR